MRTRIIRVDSPTIAVSAAAEAADILSGGGLVGLPTETVYGVAAAADNPAAMERLRDLKNRPARPFSVHVAAPSDAARYVADPPAAAKRLMQKAWPGPVTLLLRTGGRLADDAIQKSGLHDILCHGGVIGLRCPSVAVTGQILSAVRSPVVAASANLAGRPSPRNAAEVVAELDGRLDLLIDAGETQYGKDSTIVSFAADGRWEVVRKGVHDERAVRDLSTTRILFVCTGNTCRSPMAEGLAKVMLARRLGCPPDGLGARGVEALSAGIAAVDGVRASPEAVLAAGNLGADISRHRSRKLSAELIERADVIFCMTKFHADEIRGLAGGGRPVMLLDSAGDVGDPMGGGGDVYRRTAERIEKALRARMNEGLL